MSSRVTRFLNLTCALQNGYTQENMSSKYKANIQNSNKNNAKHAKQI